MRWQLPLVAFLQTKTREVSRFFLSFSTRPTIYCPFGKCTDPSRVVLADRQTHLPDEETFYGRKRPGEGKTRAESHLATENPGEKKTLTKVNRLLGSKFSVTRLDTLERRVQVRTCSEKSRSRQDECAKRNLKRLRNGELKTATPGEFPVTIRSGNVH